MSKIWTISDYRRYQKEKGKITAENSAVSTNKAPKKGKLPSKIPIIPAGNSGKVGNSPRIPKMSTNALTKHALRILDMKGFDVWRQNNGAVFDPKIQKFRKNSSTPGISDIIGFHKKTGQFIACEIKTGKDTLSTEQELFLKRVNRSGGIGIEVRKIEDLDQIKPL